LIYRVGAGLAGALGALGLVLAIIGVYGVVSYSARQHTQEIGIRMALGARGRDILRVVMGPAGAIIGLGLATGLVGAALVARLITNLLVGISATDPMTYALVSGGLGLVGAAACVVPVRRALRMELARSLRAE